LAERFPNELSGGQQQRVALARELVSGADVILMDEPLSNLDARLRMDMRVELKRLHADSDKTIIYVTHDQLEALTLSTEIAVMRKGRVQQRGTPDDIYYRPENRFVGEFLSLNPINWIEVEVGSRGLKHATLDLPLRAADFGLAHVPEGTVLAMGLRPEFLMVSAEPTNGALEGTVDAVLSAGPSKFVHVVVADGTTKLPLTVQDYDNVKLRRGDRAYVEVDPSLVLWFDTSTERVVSTGRGVATANA
jgi:ABC-type sugar transport system ATPase subunit